MACGNLLFLTRGKRLGHIFLLHHLNLMLGHFTFLYFNSLVYLREWLRTLVHWLVFSKVHAVTSQLLVLAVICVLFPLSRSWFHISNKIFEKLQSAIRLWEAVAAVLPLTFRLSSVLGSSSREQKHFSLWPWPWTQRQLTVELCWLRSEPSNIQKANGDAIPKPPTSIPLGWGP